MEIDLSSLRKNVRPERLTSIAMTAAFEDFNAFLNIYRVVLYRQEGGEQ